MDEQTLLRISMAVSIIGLFVLFFLVKTIEPKEKEINLLKDNELVSLKGKVDRVTVFGETYFITLKQENRVSVIFEKKDFLLINPGNEIEAIGKTKETDGKIELYADEIRVT